MKYRVSDSNLEDGYMKVIDAIDAEDAAESWAEIYCERQAEYDVSECFVLENGGSWVKYNITIDSHPVFYASLDTKRGAK